MQQLSPAIIAQLLATRATCEATIWGINALLEQNEQLVGQHPAEPPNESQSQCPNQSQSSTEPGTCPHPAELRQRAPVMGNPNRTMCGQCRQEVM